MSKIKVAWFFLGHGVNIRFCLLQTFRTPLGMKYACPSQSTWQLVINSLMTVLNIGLPLARKNGK